MDRKHPVQPQHWRKTLLGIVKTPKSSSVVIRLSAIVLVGWSYYNVPHFGVDPHAGFRDARSSRFVGWSIYFAGILMLVLLPADFRFVSPLASTTVCELKMRADKVFKWIEATYRRNSWTFEVQKWGSSKVSCGARLGFFPGNRSIAWPFWTGGIRANWSRIWNCYWQLSPVSLRECAE